MCSTLNIIYALAIAGAHGRRASTRTAHPVATEKVRHRLWPSSGGGPLALQSWELCLSKKSLFFFSIERCGSVESWRGGGHLFFFYSINVMVQLQRDNIITATWCAGAGFFTFYLRGGAAIEQLCASIQAAGYSFSFSVLQERNLIATCLSTVEKIGGTNWRSGCVRPVRPLLVHPYGDKRYESHERFSVLGFGTEVVKYHIFIKTLLGKTILLWVSAQDTRETIKTMIEQKEGYS